VNESEGAIPDFFALVDTYGAHIEGIFTGHMHLWMKTESQWNVTGYGLAATRYDQRNWWVMDVDLETGTWTSSGPDEVQWGSFWYDGQQPSGF